MDEGDVLREPAKVHFKRGIEPFRAKLNFVCSTCGTFDPLLLKLMVSRTTFFLRGIFGKGESFLDTIKRGGNWF